MLISIWCQARNGLIGNNNDLPWNRKDGDLDFFKYTTNGHTVIMGRKTFESLGNKPLSNRKNIVLSKSNIELPQNVKQIYNLDDIFLYNQFHLNEEIFIIGGSSIYNELINHSDKIYQTIIDGEFSGDSYIRNFDKDRFLLVKSFKFRNKTFNEYQKKVGLGR